MVNKPLIRPYFWLGCVLGVGWPAKQRSFWITRLRIESPGGYSCYTIGILQVWSESKHYQIESSNFMFTTQSCQIKIFQQPRFHCNKGISLSQLPFGVRSCEVAIIWSAKYELVVELPLGNNMLTSNLRIKGKQNRWNQNLLILLTTLDLRIFDAWKKVPKIFSQMVVVWWWWITSDPNPYDITN